MSRKFKRPDYEATLKAPIILEDALPANHLARFVVDIIAQLDLMDKVSRSRTIKEWQNGNSNYRK